MTHSIIHCVTCARASDLGPLPAGPAPGDLGRWSTQIHSHFAVPLMPDLANRVRYSDPQDPWEMIETPWGRMEAWRASTMATGEMGAYDTFMQQARADSTILNDAMNAREQELEERERNLAAREQTLNDQQATLAAQLGPFLDRVAPMAAELEERRNPELMPEPPVLASDEGELESPKQAKDPTEQDLERDLRDPDNQNLTLDDQLGGYETEFPQPGDPDFPEPAIPHDPGGD